jgi:hypothetical protein
MGFSVLASCAELYIRKTLSFVWVVFKVLNASISFSFETLNASISFSFETLNASISAFF